MKARGWHIQIYTSLPMISAIKDLVAAAPMPVVFDHFGGAQAAFGCSNRALRIWSSWCDRARPI